VLADLVEPFYLEFYSVLGQFVDGGKWYVRVSFVFLFENWVNGEFA